MAGSRTGCPQCGATRMHRLREEEPENEEIVAGWVFTQQCAIRHVLVCQLGFDVHLGHRDTLDDQKICSGVYDVRLDEDVTVWCILEGLHAWGVQ